MIRAFFFHKFIDSRVEIEHRLSTNSRSARLLGLPWHRRFLNSLQTWVVCVCTHVKIRQVTAFDRMCVPWITFSCKFIRLLNNSIFGLLLVFSIRISLHFIHKVKNLVFIEKVHLYLIIVVDNVSMHDYLLSYLLVFYLVFINSNHGVFVLILFRIMLFNRYEAL